MARTRLIAPSDEILEELGKEMIQWCHADPERHLFFAQFYTTHGIIRKEWKVYILNPTFLPYYEEAQGILAERYIDGTVNPSIAHRFIRLYHHDVREDEDETASQKNRAVSESGLNLCDIKDALIEKSLKGDISLQKPVQDAPKA